MLSISEHGGRQHPSDEHVKQAPDEWAWMSVLPVRQDLSHDSGEKAGRECRVEEGEASVVAMSSEMKAGWCGVLSSKCDKASSICLE